MADTYPNTAGYKDQGASKDGAETIRPKLATRRAEVLQAFDRLGNATPDQIADLIDRPHHSTRPRVSELYLLGELIKTDERRQSAFGAGQSVYRRATPIELALFAARKAEKDEKGPANG